MTYPNTAERVTTNAKGHDETLMAVDGNRPPCPHCRNSSLVMADVSPPVAVPCPNCDLGAIRDNRAGFNGFWTMQRRERLTYDGGITPRHKPCAACGELFDPTADNPKSHMMQPSGGVADCAIAAKRRDIAAKGQPPRHIQVPQAAKLY